MHAGCSPTLLNFAVPSFCWIRFPLYLLLCTVFLLNADPSLLTGLCNSLSAGFASVESFALLPFSCFKHVWHRFLGILSLDLSTLSLSSSLARDLQHITWRLSCCLLEVGHQQNLDLVASHRLGHLCFSRHMCCDSTNTSTRSFQDVRISSGIFSLVELEMQISRPFSL